MFDDSHNLPSNQTSWILDLPVELRHQIASFLDIPAIFALRKTCKSFFEYTQERSLWLIMFEETQANQLLPRCRSDLDDMSVLDIERMLLGAFRVGRSFMVPRERTKSVFHSRGRNTGAGVHCLSFINEHYLLAADNNGIITLWDMQDCMSSDFAAQPHPSALLFLSSWNLLAHQLSSNKSTLYIAVTSQLRAQIYTIPIKSNVKSEPRNRPGFECVAEFNTPLPDSIKAIDPELNLVLLYNGAAASIHAINWRTNAQAAIPLQSSDTEELWNGVLALRLCGPYILCFRLHSIDAYPVPSAVHESSKSEHPQSWPVLKHSLYSLIMFRRVSLSDVRSTGAPSGRNYTFFAFANDLFRGTFHYQITIKVTPVPQISVKLLAVDSDVRLRNSPNVDMVRSALGPNSRGIFVSAIALGSVGMRGVWVDRYRGNTERRVVAFTTDPGVSRRNERPSQEEIANDEGTTTAESVARIDGKVIWSIPSCDLRDDITICAVSEFTGHVALGSRSGTISII